MLCKLVFRDYNQKFQILESFEKFPERIPTRITNKVTGWWNNLSDFTRRKSQGPLFIRESSPIHTSSSMSWPILGDSQPSPPTSQLPTCSSMIIRGLKGEFLCLDWGNFLPGENSQIWDHRERFNRTSQYKLSFTCKILPAQHEQSNFSSSGYENKLEVIGHFTANPSEEVLPDQCPGNP